MADSIYDQVLTIAAPQIKTLADAIESYIVQEADLTPRELDWDDVQQHSPGISVRYVLDVPRRGNVMASTNTHNVVGFPIIVVLASPKGGFTRDPESKAFESLKQSIRQYYHHRRRMADVDSEGVLTSVSTVNDGGPEVPGDIAALLKIQMVTIMFWFEEPQAP
jgi:hypothetical protein